jgi:hypothetical protein
VLGLKAAPRADRPYVPLVFWAFRLMAGIGFVLAAIAGAGAWLRWRGRLYDTGWFSFLCGFEPAPVQRRARRPDRDRDRPPALCRLWAAADCRCSSAGRGPRGHDLAGVVRYRLYGAADRVFFYATRTVLRGPGIPEPAAPPVEVRRSIDSALAKSPAE